jgi:glycosyltransferase involved in cell wall biosynthesis
MLTQDKLAVYYASSDLFVFPSQSETFGNVTLEALASGLPVLAFDCAAAMDWVKPGVNGWLIPESNPEAFAAKAREVILTKGLLAQVSASTRNQLVQLDWCQISDQVEEVMLDAIKHHRY